LDFLQKATKRTKIFAAAEDKAFVSFVIFCLESSPCCEHQHHRERLDTRLRAASAWQAADFTDQGKSRPVCKTTIDTNRPAFAQLRRGKHE